jgi:hypothetical protein
VDKKVDNKQQLITNLLKFIYLNESNGAAERTRTFTGVTPQRPQRCASTNSATAARCSVLLEVDCSKGKCHCAAFEKFHEALLFSTDQPKISQINMDKT